MRFAAPFLLSVVFLTGVPSKSHETSADYTPPASPPPEFQQQYDELSQKLTSFESQVDSSWDGSLGSGRFAGSLLAANGNKSAGLLAQGQWTLITEMLDAYEAMGVRLIKLDINYPLLTPAFHTYLQAHPPPAIPNYTLTAANFIGNPNSFYNRLAAEIRSRGLGLWIEHGTLFADYSPTPPGPYFADMRAAGLPATRTRYTQERSAEAAAIVSQLQPDYFNILEEPNTQNDNFGYFAGQTPLFDPDGWTGYVQDAAAAIAGAAPGSPTLLGAGSGTWDGTAYLTRFAPLPELDFFDMHIYPLQSLTADYLQNAITWTDYVRSVDPGKKVTIGESWVYKTTKAEVSNGLDYNTIFGRDVYSFWEPIDRQWLDVLFKLMQYKDIEAIMPFWSLYYFAYLTYGDPDIAGLSGVQLIAAAGEQAEQNWPNMVLTGTGERFRDLNLDADGDAYPDAMDSCPLWANPTQALPNWSVPASGDSDCDGYAEATVFAPRAAEATIGTVGTQHCAGTSGFNDEPMPDAWPPDFNDNQLVNGADILSFNNAFSKHTTDPPIILLGQSTPISRFDLNGSGLVNGSDILQLNAFFSKRCA
jgi:hypothetical protein